MEEARFTGLHLAIGGINTAENDPVNLSESG